ncbi:MAG: hypothetical protein ACP5MT_02320 [Candidatus Acidifodinimicrobium sp.]
MGLKELSEKISLDAKSMIKQINKEAEEKIEAIKDKTNKEIERLRKENTEKLEKDKLNALEAARLEGESLAREIVNKRENEILEASLRSIESSLGEIKKQIPYKKLLDVLSSECIDKLGKDAKIYVNREDIPLLSKKMNVIASDKKMMGGIFAVSADNKRVIDYSLESILASLKDIISKKLIEHIEGK